MSPADEKRPAVATTVLVIEDDEMVTEVVRIALTADGYQVLHAPSGEAGFATLADHAVDLVLLDLVLSEGNGLDVLMRLREGKDAASLPVIVLASRAMPADEVRGEELGATSYLNKPFTAAELSEKVRAALAARPD